MTTDERIAARRADLLARRAAILDDDQLPASTTRGELAIIRQLRATLDRQLTDLHAAAAAVDALGTTEADTTWRDQLEAWRRALADRLLAIKAPIRDARLLGHRINLQLSLKAIDDGPQALANTGYSLVTTALGELMREAGYLPVGADPERSFTGEMPWHGSLKEVEKRLTALAAERARAESALEDALLTDAERAAQQAEAKALNDASNSMRIFVGPDGKSLVAFKNQQDMVNGVVYAVAEMTDLQRKAFTRDDERYRNEQAARQPPTELVTS